MVLRSADSNWSEARTLQPLKLNQGQRVEAGPWFAPASQAVDTIPVDEALTIPTTFGEKKDVYIRQSLIKVLPVGEALRQSLQKGNLIWSVLAGKLSSEPKYESLESFARHATERGTPCELALVALVLSYYSSPSEVQRTTRLVDRLVLSDDEFMASLPGLECAIMQGNLLNELGQSKRAWQTWRKAICHAQLMSLHTTRRTPQEEMVWEGLYVLDRTASLLIGQPYAIPDRHCVFTPPDVGTSPWCNFRSFLFRLSQIIGPCIDYLHRGGGVDSSSVAALMQLDRDLATFASTLPASFWHDEPPAIATADRARTLVWRYRTMNKLAYHQTFLALFAPFLLSADGPRTGASAAAHRHFRARCVAESRSFLRLHQEFRRRSPAGVVKCRAFDATSCAASMILVLGLWGGGAAASLSPPSPAGGGGVAGTAAAEDDCNDWGLVQGAMQVYRHCVARDADERAAYHSGRSLQQLLQTRSLAAQPDGGGGAAGEVEFTIPFFSDALLAADGNPFCALGIMPPPSPLNDMILGSTVSAPRTLQVAAWLPWADETYSPFGEARLDPFDTAIFGTDHGFPSGY
jgi:hypothetical protein